MTKNPSDKVDVFMPIYIGDYLKDTTFLTTEQHGAYLLMLFACWQHGSIPNDDGVICRITGLSTDAWSNARSMLLSYFEESGGNLTQGRITQELIKAREKRKKAHEKASKAARARWGDACSNEQAMHKQCPSPSPAPTEPSLLPEAPEPKENKNHCSFLDLFNEVTGKSHRKLPEKAKRQLNARIRDGFTIDEICQAANNAANSDHHKRDNLRSLTPEFITRADKLDMWMNAKPVEKTDWENI